MENISRSPALLSADEARMHELGSMALVYSRLQQPQEQSTASQDYITDGRLYVDT
jgi:hypothetical protein